MGEQDEEQRKARANVVKIGIDPHYSFANMLCYIAWARSHGNSFMILPDTPAAAAAAAQEGPKQPGAELPDAVVAAMEELAVGGTCGRCVSFKGGLSRARFLNGSGKASLHAPHLGLAGGGCAFRQR